MFQIEYSCMYNGDSVPSIKVHVRDNCLAEVRGGVREMVSLATTAQSLVTSLVAMLGTLDLSSLVSGKIFQF